MKSISVHELHELISAGFPDNAMLLDVRPVDSHAKGHIPGAVNLPSDELASRLEELKGYDVIYLHCTKGGRSGRACELLAGHGLTQQVNIEGGYEAWKAAGF